MISVLDEITQCYESISRVMSIVSANTTRATTMIRKHLGNKPRLLIDSGYHEVSNGFAIGSPLGGCLEFSLLDDGKIELKTIDIDWLTFEFDLHSDRRGETVVEAMFDLQTITPVEMFTRVFTSASAYDDRDHTRRFVETGTLMVCTMNYAPMPEPNLQKLIMLIPNPPAILQISRLACLVLA